MRQNSVFSIEGRPIGVGHPMLVVAEVGLAHDGSLGIAHAFIDLVSRCGADAVKFQTHCAADESSAEEPWRKPFSRQDASRFDYWNRTAFTETQWHDLKNHARDAGLIFLSSPFSLEAFELLRRIDVPAWKIASGEVLNPLLIERIAQTGRPVLMSTGLCTDRELDEAVQLVSSCGAPLAILQCTSQYPSPPQQWDLPRIHRLRDRYACPVGLSDHSGTIYAGLAAAALGANILEVHVTMSRDMFGPDVAASVTGTQLKQLVEGCRMIEQSMWVGAAGEGHSLGSGENDRGQESHEVAATPPDAHWRELRWIFGKSLVARRPLAAGHRLQLEDLDARKPANGLPATQWRSLLGCRLARDVSAGERLAESDLVGSKAL